MTVICFCFVFLVCVRCGDNCLFMIHLLFMMKFKILNFAHLQNGAIHCKKNEIKTFSEVITVSASTQSHTMGGIKSKNL